MLKYFIGTVIFLNSSEILLAADLASMANVTGLKVPIEMIPIALGGLRLLAEGLGWIAQKTENKWDNKVAAGLAAAVNFLGWGVGQFGIGSPKNVKPIGFPKDEKAE